MKQFTIAVCAMALLVPLLAPAAHAVDLGVNVLGVGADVRVNKHGVGAGGRALVDDVAVGPLDGVHPEDNAAHTKREAGPAAKILLGCCKRSS